MKEFSWWTGTANHLWRAFFILSQSNQLNLSPADRKTVSVCSAAFSRFSERDQSIIKAYYTCRWGDTVYAVEDYSSRTGTPIPVIYSVIKRAGYAVMNELELINPYGYERKCDHEK